MDVSYAPGQGVLVARRLHWLLLAPLDPTRLGPLVDQLWEDLAHPTARDRALATARRLAPGHAIAYLAGGTGDRHAEHGTTVERRGDTWHLGLGDTGAGAPERETVRLPLVEGVVRADRVEVTGLAVVEEPPRPATLLIDGIPPEIMAGGDGPAPRAATPSPPDHDHDHHTVLRSRRPAPAPPPDAVTPAQLQHTTQDTVLAVRCPSGHLTDALGPTCRTCASPVSPQEPRRVLRPQLGRLHLPDGGVVPLDRSVVLGRRPAPDGPGDWPHLVHLPQDSSYLSRRHLRIDLDGWHVLARDLGSSSGTTLLAPGRDPEKIRAQEPYLLEHGTTLDLAGVYRVVYLSTPGGPS